MTYRLATGLTLALVIGAAATAYGQTQPTITPPTITPPTITPPAMPNMPATAPSDAPAAAESSAAPTTAPGASNTMKIGGQGCDLAGAQQSADAATDQTRKQKAMRQIKLAEQAKQANQQSLCRQHVQKAHDALNGI